MKAADCHGSQNSEWPYVVHTALTTEGQGLQMTLQLVLPETGLHPALLGRRASRFSWDLRIPVDRPAQSGRDSQGSACCSGQSADIFLLPLLLLTSPRPSLRPVLMAAVKQLLLCAGMGRRAPWESPAEYPDPAVVGPACPWVVS